MPMFLICEGPLQNSQVTWVWELTCLTPGPMMFSVSAVTPVVNTHLSHT